MLLTQRTNLLYFGLDRTASNVSAPAPLLVLRIPGVSVDCIGAVALVERNCRICPLRLLVLEVVVLVTKAQTTVRAPLRVEAVYDFRGPLVIIVPKVFVAIDDGLNRSLGLALLVLPS